MYGISDKVLNSIIESAISYELEYVILFGSRARGNYKERSDIDLAVLGKNADIFGIEAEEKIPTLLKFDVVNMGKPIQKDLLDSIKKDGVIIYEKI